MKFRIMLILAIMFCAVAMNAIMVRVYIWPTAPQNNDTGEIRVYNDVQELPNFKKFRMPEENQPTHLDIWVPDTQGAERIFAEINFDGETYIQQTTFDHPYFVFYFN